MTILRGSVKVRN